MTVPGGGASALVMSKLSERLPAGKSFLMSGNGSVGAGAIAAGGLRLGSFFIPFTCSFTGIGCMVTAAGAAGTTVTPVVYAASNTGLPTGNPIVQGTPLAGDAIGQPLSLQAFTLNAGWYWGGVLPLVGNPSVITLSRSGVSPWGSLMLSDAISAGGTGPFAFLNGIGAIPAPIDNTGYTLNAGSTAALVFQT